MKRLTAAVTAAVLALCLTSCSGLTIFSNYRRLENIELVRTVTADSSGDGVNVAIYGTVGEESEARMYEQSGPSIGVAMGKLTLMPLGREAVLSHTETMLIGQELAGEHLAECLDYIERFSEMRLDTGILIVRDSSARDLLYGLSGPDTPASDIIAGFDKNISRVGEGYVFTCREIASSLARNGCALVMCVRGVKEEKLFDARGDLDLEPAGFAVMLESGGAAHFLDDRETLGAMLFLGKYRSRNLDLAVDGGVLTVSVDEVRTGFRPVFGPDGELSRLDITLDLQANVIGMDGLVDLDSAALRRSAESELARIMGGAARAAVERSQLWGIDYLDLEGIVSRRAPLKLEDMPRPMEEIFPALEVRIDTSATLMRTYDIIDPPQIAGEEERTFWEKLTEPLTGSPSGS